MGTSVTFADLAFMLNGLKVTLILTLVSLAFGTAAGIALGWVRAEAGYLTSAGLGFVLDVPKSVPLLIQFILLNTMSSMFRWGLSSYTIALAILSVYTAAFCAEIVRGAILSVPQQTRKAARSLGMTYWQSLLWIVRPIAFRFALPSWTGLSLVVMKDTALVLWIGIIELLRSTQIVVGRTQEPFFVLLICGALYFAISAPLSYASRRIESKWGIR